MNEITREEREVLTVTGIISQVEVHKKNLEVSKNKISVFEFVLTTTKADFYFEALQGKLYWGGLTEFFLWVVLIGLFISDVHKMKMIWFFLYHIPRGTIGLVLLSYLPKTCEAMKGIEQIESNDLEEIEKNIIDGYVNMFLSKEKVLKPLLICYFVLTLVSVVVDILLFCVITPDFGTKNLELTFFALFFSVICFIAEDFMFLLFYSSFKYTFHPAQTEAIRKAMMGFFTQLKVGIATGFTNIAKKIVRSTSNVNANAANDANPNDNEPKGNSDNCLNHPFDINLKEEGVKEEVIINIDNQKSNKRNSNELN